MTAEFLMQTHKLPWSVFVLIVKPLFPSWEDQFGPDAWSSSDLSKCATSVCTHIAHTTHEDKAKSLLAHVRKTAANKLVLH